MLNDRPSDREPEELDLGVSTGRDVEALMHAGEIEHIGRRIDAST
jgi:hypothetical protein